MRLFPPCILLALLAATGSGMALELPSVFSDHMVLQQGRPVPVWGKGAAADSEVTVTFGSQVQKVRAGADGAWQVELEPLTASSQGQSLTVKSGNATQQVSDVLVGEVWLCSGQSNMAWPISNSQDSDLEVATANRPLLRLFIVDRVVGPEERWSSAGSWQVCSPETVKGFSAVGYRFGVTLQEALGVPVGLIQSSWGGTPAIAWTRLSAMDRHPLLTER